MALCWSSPIWRISGISAPKCSPRKDIDVKWLNEPMRAQVILKKLNGRNNEHWSKTAVNTQENNSFVYCESVWHSKVWDIKLKNSFFYIHFCFSIDLSLSKLEVTNVGWRKQHIDLVLVLRRSKHVFVEPVNDASLLCRCLYTDCYNPNPLQLNIFITTTRIQLFE